MKLTQLSKQPELVKITLDDEETIEQYGEALDFWIYDRVDMDTFVKLAMLKPENFGEMVRVVNNLIRDEDGSQIVKDGYNIPTSLIARVVTKVVETLGK